MAYMWFPAIQCEFQLIQILHGPHTYWLLMCFRHTLWIWVSQKIYILSALAAVELLTYPVSYQAAPEMVLSKCKLPPLVPQVVCMETISKRTTSRAERLLTGIPRRWSQSLAVVLPPYPIPRRSWSSGCTQPPNREKHLWCPVGPSESSVALHVSTRVKSLMRLGNFLSRSGGLLTV